MVCGDRHDAGIYSRENKRPMHNTGNKAVRMLITNCSRATCMTS